MIQCITVACPTVEALAVLSTADVGNLAKRSGEWAQALAIEVVIKGILIPVAFHQARRLASRLGMAETTILTFERAEILAFAS